MHVLLETVRLGSLSTQTAMLPAIETSMTSEYLTVFASVRHWWQSCLFSQYHARIIPDNAACGLRRQDKSEAAFPFYALLIAEHPSLYLFLGHLQWQERHRFCSIRLSCSCWTFAGELQQAYSAGQAQQWARSRRLHFGRSAGKCIWQTAKGAAG